MPLTCSCLSPLSLAYLRRDILARFQIVRRQYVVNVLEYGCSAEMQLLGHFLRSVTSFCRLNSPIPIATAKSAEMAVADRVRSQFPDPSGFRHWIINVTTAAATTARTTIPKAVLRGCCLISPSSCQSVVRHHDCTQHHFAFPFRRVEFDSPNVRGVGVGCWCIISAWEK